MNLTIFGFQWQHVLAALLAAIFGVIQFWPKGWKPFTFFSKTPTEPAQPASDPDRRSGFTERLHWLTEFARNDLADQEMIDDLNKVHQRFTLLRPAEVNQ